MTVDARIEPFSGPLPSITWRWDAETDILSGAFKDNRKGGGLTGTDFAAQLMQQTGVAIVPGAAFGDDRWVRMSYAVSDRELDAALTRMLELIRSLATVTAA